MPLLCYFVTNIVISEVILEPLAVCNGGI